MSPVRLKWLAAGLGLVLAVWLWDPINRLQLRLMGDSMWRNGFSTIIRLPASASSRDVVQQYWLSEDRSARKTGAPVRRILETKAMSLLSLWEGAAFTLDGSPG